MAEELNIRISDGRSSDIDAFAELEQLCFPVPWSRRAIEVEALGNRLFRFYAAELDGRICGCVSCWLLPPYECQLGNVAVHPDFRRRGIARAMLQRLIADTQAQGIMDMTLEVRASNIAAQNLYGQLGFEAEGIRKGYYQGKEDAVIMWRRETLTTR